MPRKPDWMDFAHLLDKEREEIQDRLPDGVKCSLTLASYGYGGAEFSVHLNHTESKLSGFGSGRTPAKALEAAKQDMAQKAREQARKPQLVTAVRELPPKAGAS